MEIEHGSEGKFPRRSNFSPRQESIGRVEVETASLIGLDYRLRIISEKLIKVVEIAKGSRTYVGGVESAAVNAIAACDLELFVDIIAAIREGKDTVRT